MRHAIVHAPHHGAHDVLSDVDATIGDDDVPKPPLAMPPGYWMDRIARGIFFFSPKTIERVFEEIVADYRHETIEAEAKGRSAGTMRRIKAQHWGGFIIAVLEELAGGVVGKIVKVLKGS